MGKAFFFFTKSYFLVHIKVDALGGEVCQIGDWENSRLDVNDRRQGKTPRDRKLTSIQKDMEIVATNYWTKLNLPTQIDKCSHFRILAKQAYSSILP